MDLPEIIAIIVIVLIVGLALLYVIKAKKKGQKCIGCPYAKTCHENKKREDNSCSNCRCGCNN